MSGLLRLEKVSVNFGGLQALRDVDLEVPGGRIVSLIGPNGAGKTTLFNLLTGLYRPTSGNIFFMERDISGLKPHERARLGIARTFQHPRLVRRMSVLENVLAAHPVCRSETLWSALYPSRRILAKRAGAVEECMDALETVGLHRRTDEWAGSLPYGEQKLLEIARALVTRCKVLLLDEPAAGMNAPEKKRLAEIIRHLSRQRRIDIVLIEHDMRLVMDLSDRIAVLDHGVKIAEGTPEEIRSHPRVIGAYFGSGGDGRNHENNGARREIR